MQRISTLFRIASLRRALYEFYIQLTEAFESPEKRQCRILKKFISE